MTEPTPKPRSPTRLPGTVVALGLVSMFMDVSSETIHSILPLFLTTVLGVGTVSVGIIEGIAEATASVTKVFAGAVSDWLRRRKALVLLGYGLSALTKPLFPLATGVGAVFVARFLDRVGKGIRDAPRDALVADVTPAASRGAAYGLRQALDTVGAFAGPLIALVLMMASGDDFRFVFWIAVFPAAVAVAIIVVAVRDPDAAPAAHAPRFPIRRDEIVRLRGRYWSIVAFGGVLTLARFSEAFLLLRAENVGLARTYVPLVLIVMNAFYAVSAYPFGGMSDRGRPRVFAGGIVLLLVADVLLATADRVWLVLAGAASWGLHMGATQGLLTAMVADAAPADLRGTAFGLFNLVTGAGLLVASVLAGWLWRTLGPQATFLAGAGFCTVALVGLLLRTCRALDGR